MQALWLGARGPSVVALQSRLRDLGYYHGMIDGSFGPRTEESVMLFQQAHGLAADGYVGPKTLAALELAPGAGGNRPSKRSQVFISYSHKDTKWLEQLRIHLAPLERQGIVTRWDDALIEPGRNWRKEISAAIAQAKVAVLLLSPNFMASDFIQDSELQAFWSAAQREGLTIIPVIVRPCIMGPLADLQAVNSPDRPLVDLSQGDRDRTWIKLVESITTALNA